MKIAVLVKQVPGSESPLSIADSNIWLDEEKVAYIMNESDNYALEEALLLKEGTQDCEVVVVSLGPERVKKIIREGLAKGADRGIHLNMNSNDVTDPLSIAKIFADALKSENFDLILSGSAVRRFGPWTNWYYSWGTSKHVHWIFSCIHEIRRRSNCNQTGTGSWIFSKCSYVSSS